MEKLDVILQALMLSTALVLLSIALATGGETWILLLLVQFLTGCYQLLTGLYRFFRGQREELWYKRHIRLYLGLSGAYLMGFFFVFFLPIPDMDNDALQLVGLVTLPWCLALFYFWSSWKRWTATKHSAQASGYFLTHISF